MRNYEEQYYILRAAKGDQVPYLGPDENTVERNCSFERQPVGSAPLVFTNTERERNLAERVKDAVAPILFHGSNPLVSSAIRDALLAYDIPDMFMHPAIYIDDRDKWHEGYWYLTFTELFDCWGRENSDTSTSCIETNGKKHYDVYEYVLDKELLDKTPLEKRLFFQMGGAVDAFVFCHESIAGLFRRDIPNGARLVLAADY
jgi:hypothetical protein